MSLKPTVSGRRPEVGVQRPPIDQSASSSTHLFPDWRSAPRLFSVLWPLTSSSGPVVHSPLLPLCSLLFALCSASAQDALRLSLSGQTAAAQRRRGLENLPYTVRWGDLKLLTSASMAGEWNDNVNLVNSDPQQDFVLRPLGNLNVFWPVTELNLLTFSLGVCYEKFLQHGEYDRALITPGSALGWEVFIKDWRFNFHDQFSYEQDPTAWGAISGTARFGGFYNTAGLLASWDLHDVVLSFGYDHFNFVSSSSRFAYLSRASDFALVRAGFKVHPAAIAGVEVTGGPTAYAQRTLSDNTSYSFGVFADWQLTEQIKMQPRGGYYIYSFSNQGLVGGGTDQTGYYFSLNLNHRPSAKVNYSLEGGREAYFGNNSALTEQWYGSGWVSWRLIQHISLTTGFRYEIASQPIAFRFNDNYDRASANIRLSCPIKEKLTVSLDYRYFVKNSEHLQILNYEQDRLTLQMAYHF